MFYSGMFWFYCYFDQYVELVETDITLMSSYFDNVDVRNEPDVIESDVIVCDNEMWKLILKILSYLFPEELNFIDVISVSVQ